MRVWGSGSQQGRNRPPSMVSIRLLQGPHEGSEVTAYGLYMVYTTSCKDHKSFETRCSIKRVVMVHSSCHYLAGWVARGPRVSWLTEQEDHCQVGKTRVLHSCGRTTGVSKDPIRLT